MSKTKFMTTHGKVSQGKNLEEVDSTLRDTHSKAILEAEISGLISTGDMVPPTKIGSTLNRSREDNKEGAPALKPTAYKLYNRAANHNQAGTNNGANNVSQSKWDSMRSNTNVPGAAGFRKAGVAAEKIGHPVQIRTASVDEFLGEGNDVDSRIQYPGFKTSKIILQSKGG